MFREKVSKNSADRMEQRDRFSRKAKHKAIPEEVYMDEDQEQTIQIGDTVSVDGREGMVKDPDAPYGMIGVSFDGTYELVDPNGGSKIDLVRQIDEALEDMSRLSK